MEDAYRTHKGNASFGWVAMLQDYLAARKARRLERDLTAWRESRARAKERSRHVLDDLHAPAGPH